MKQFLSQNMIKKQIGPQFNSSLVSVNDNDESQDQFNFLDYFPLINARAHRIGGMD